MLVFLSRGYGATAICASLRIFGRNLCVGTTVVVFGLCDFVVSVSY